MARRRSMYGRKRKINYGRILLLVLLLVVVIALVFLLFKRDKYIGVIDKVLKSDISEISGTISSISNVDIKVYSNNGIRYTNQHEDIKKLNSFGGAEDSGKSAEVKKLFESLPKSKETSSIEDLPSKKDGYYWIDADFAVNKDKYNFDLYYDIENKTIYIKKEYFNEFSTRNNKQKLQGYKATDEFVKVIEDLAKTK